MAGERQLEWPVDHPSKLTVFFSPSGRANDRHLPTGETLYVETSNRAASYCCSQSWSF
ncbi:hypothetical protein CCP4SC76_4250002 [Gammaproteobacteria bacterium]